MCWYAETVSVDRYVETVSGKDTLHDTVGIAYETSSSATGESVDFQAEDQQEVKISGHTNEESFVVKKKRRRKLVATGYDIEPLQEETENVIF